MGTITVADMLTVNWNNLFAVTTLANKLGPGFSVIRYADRANYNIIHTANEIQKAKTSAFRVCYRTQSEGGMKWLGGKDEVIFPS